MKRTIAKLGLWLLCLTEVIAAAGVLLWLQSPPRAESSGNHQEKAIQTVQSETEVNTDASSVELLSQHWNRKFQDPLFDPPPVPEPTAPPPPPLQVALIGTIIQSGNSTALVSLPDGGVLFCSVGDVIGRAPTQATVKQIDADAVRLSYFDQELTLEVPVSN